MDQFNVLNNYVNFVNIQSIVFVIHVHIGPTGTCNWKWSIWKTFCSFNNNNKFEHRISRSSLIQCYNASGLWFLRILPRFQDFFTNLPLPQNVLKRRQLGSSQYYVQTSSFLFVGIWRVCKSSKIKHPGGSGAFVLYTKRETQAHYPFFRIFLLLSNHTPVALMICYYYTLIHIHDREPNSHWSIHHHVPVVIFTVCQVRTRAFTHRVNTHA